MLIQNYANEEGIYPCQFKKALGSDNDELRKQVEEKQRKREEERVKELLDEKNKAKVIRRKFQPLNQNNHILIDHRDSLVSLLEQVSDFPQLLGLKPLQFRKSLTKIIFGTEGKSGNDLRELWIAIYKGSLTYGVMSQRKKAASKKWPKTKSYPSVRDRNSWLSFFFRKSCMTKV